MTSEFPAPRALRRDLLKFSGPDTDTLLQGLLTTDVTAITQGQIGYSALLTPQGKIIDTLFVFRTAPDTLILELMPDRGPGFLKKMMLYRLRADVEMTEVAGEMTTGIGPGPTGATVSAGDPRHGGLPAKWLIEGPGEAPMGDDNLIAAEIQLGIPAFGIAYQETDAFSLGVNLDALGGIDHKKGCFVGQEVASRMYRKGSIRKRTWCLTAGDDDVVQPCDDLVIDGRSVAMVSAVKGRHGLALMRLDRIDGDGPVTATAPSGATVQLHKPDYLS